LPQNNLSRCNRARQRPANQPAHWDQRFDFHLEARPFAKPAAVGVSQKAVKRELGVDGSTRTYTDKHGNVGEMDVSKLRRGRTAAAAVPISQAKALFGQPSSSRLI
jgi:hypothetical protein